MKHWLSSRVPDVPVNQVETLKKSPGVAKCPSEDRVVIFIFWRTQRVKSLFFIINLVDYLWRAPNLRDTFEGTCKNISGAIKAGHSRFFTTDSGRLPFLLISRVLLLSSRRDSVSPPTFCLESKEKLIGAAVVPAGWWLFRWEFFFFKTRDLGVFTLWTVRGISGPGSLLLSWSL